jgi:hypothetical protein
MEQVYHYLTGTKFRQRVDAVVENFNHMQDDLDKNKVHGRQWAKRETQVLSVLDSTVSMIGDLQAIGGKAIPEIPSLDMHCGKMDRLSTESGISGTLTSSLSSSPSDFDQHIDGKLAS